MYHSQLTELAATEWQGKKIRLIVSGDYEFLTTNYGLSGSSGVQPRFFCLAWKKSMQAPPSEAYTVRTTSMLVEDYSGFVAASANIARIKHHNNVIRPVILPVQLNNVCVPILHLDLGIFPWIYDAMCSEVKSLDNTLAA